MSEHCPYYQTLCKPNNPNQFGCAGKYYRNCNIYQEITENLVKLQQEGKLEEVLIEEMDIGSLL